MAVIETIKIQGDGSDLEATIKKLNAAAEQLAKSIAAIQSQYKDGFDTIANGAKKAGAEINNNLNGSIDKVSGGIGDIRSESKKSFEAITTDAGKASDNLSTDFNNLSKSVTVDVNKISESISDLDDSGFSSITNGANQAASEINNNLNGSIENLSGTIGDVRAESKKSFDAISSGAEKVADAVASAEESGLNSIGRAADRAFKKVQQAIKSALKLKKAKPDAGPEPIKPKVETDEAKSEVNELSDAIRELITLLSGTQAQSKQGFESMAKGVKKVEKETKKTTGAIGRLVGTIKGLAIVTAVGDTIMEVFTSNQKVVDLFNTTINTIKILFSELAEVVFPVVQKALDALFTDPVQAIKDFGKIVTDYALNLFKQLGNSIGALGKATLAFFKGDFAEASKQAKEAFSEVVDGVVGVEEGGLERIKKAAERVSKRVKEAIKEGTKLTELEKAAALADVKRQKIQLEQQRLAEIQRQQRDDEFASIEDRIKANEALGKILEDQYTLEAAQIEKKIAFAQAQYNINKTTENAVALAQANLELIDLQERLEGQRSEQKMNYISLLREEKDIERSNTDAYIARLEAQLNLDAELIDSERQRLMVQLQNIEVLKTARMAAIEDELANTKAGTARYAELVNQRAEIEQNAAIDTAKIKKDLNQKDIEDRKMVNDAYMNLAQQSFSALTTISELFAGGNEARQRKAFQINKALQIADATMATYTAVIGALSAKGADGLLPFPVRVANAAAAGIIGAANVAKIAATKFDSAEAPTPDTSAPDTGGASITPQFNVVGRGGVNQLAASINGRNNQPIQAYVVAGEVTSAQQLARRRARTATFG